MDARLLKSISRVCDIAGAALILAYLGESGATTWLRVRLSHVPDMRCDSRFTGRRRSCFHARSAGLATQTWALRHVSTCARCSCPAGHSHCCRGSALTAIDTVGCRRRRGLHRSAPAAAACGVGRRNSAVRHITCRGALADAARAAALWYVDTSVTLRIWFARVPDTPQHWSSTWYGHRRHHP